jgi:hypothetical protein
MPSSNSGTIPLADRDGLETITDFQGFIWVISDDGQKAALLHGPPDGNGQYTWEAAREIGQDVDLALPATAHAQFGNGPCRLEIFLYLVNRNRTRPKSSQLLKLGLSYVEI